MLAWTVVALGSLALTSLCVGGVWIARFFLHCAQNLNEIAFTLREVVSELNLRIKELERTAETLRSSETRSSVNVIATAPIRFAAQGTKAQTPNEDELQALLCQAEEEVAPNDAFVAYRAKYDDIVAKNPQILDDPEMLLSLQKAYKVIDEKRYNLLIANHRRIQAANEYLEQRVFEEKKENDASRAADSRAAEIWLALDSYTASACTVGFGFDDPIKHRVVTVHDEQIASDFPSNDSDETAANSLPSVDALISKPAGYRLIAGFQLLKDDYHAESADERE